MFVSHSRQETFAFAEKMAQSLQGGEIITLSGELGAGKTVFVKGLGYGLGVIEPILSPTFTIMNEYMSGRLKLYHYDAYRLSDADEAYEAGLTEFFGIRDGVCVVEWAENIADALRGMKKIAVTIGYAGENTREIEVVNE